MRPKLLLPIVITGILLSAIPSVYAQEGTDTDQTIKDTRSTETTETIDPQKHETSSNSEITSYDPKEAPLPAEVLSADPLDANETSATLAVIGVDETADIEDVGDTADEVSEMLESTKPYGKGDMELAIGLGVSSGGYGSGFTFVAGAVFAYYVANRFAHGLEIDYLATFGDVKYPQSFTLFPFLKYVLVRSYQFAPYVLLGGGRTMQWGGADSEINTETGEIYGFSAVGSWVAGMGGGLMIGLGARSRLQLQLLAMYRVHDEQIWTDVGVQSIEQTDATGNRVFTYRLVGERRDRYWYPAPSFWFSFAF